ncbi:type VI secretion-associated protein [Gammaproteobacteria bacterium 53_120_T64]|mgnify:CR=1 FL=1|nr:type VI secretion-associated protein [Gammaproteobacteria bacterium 53_120_T64]
MNTPSAPKIGLYGKAPAHSDFIDRQLPMAFIGNWDGWLQRCISCSRERLGDSWLDLYLTSPIWRFMLSPGAIDPQGWCGVVSPSVDSVGRYFPLTIAMPLPAATGLALFCQHNEVWFQGLETVVLDALQSGHDADQLDAQLQQIAPPLGNTQNPGDNRNIALSASGFSSALAAQLDAQLGQHYASHSLWFSIYTQPAMQNLLLAQGMPSDEQYTAMLDNQWQQWGWGQANASNDWGS